MAKGCIIVNEELCKGCQLCIGVCPHQLIQVADHYNSRGYRPVSQVDAEGLCTACAACATICPDAVILVFRKTKADHADPRNTVCETA